MVLAISECGCCAGRLIGCGFSGDSSDGVLGTSVGARERVGEWGGKSDRRFSLFCCLKSLSKFARSQSLAGFVGSADVCGSSAWYISVLPLGSLASLILETCSIESSLVTKMEASYAELS